MQITPCVCGQPAKTKRCWLFFHTVVCANTSCPAFTRGYRSLSSAIEEWESKEFRREIRCQISLRTIINAANLGVRS